MEPLARMDRDGAAHPWYTQVEGVVRNALDRVDNPLTRGVGAGALTAALIAATTAFGPIGVVGTGWWLVYAVASGTFGLETSKLLLGLWRDTPRAKRQRLAEQLETLRIALERGAITEQERDREAKALVSRALDAETEKSGLAIVRGGSTAPPKS
jgi:hypothetical protein